LSNEGKEHKPTAFHGLGYRGNLGTLVVIGPHHGGPIGAPAPLVTSFNSGIFLATTVVDRALKGSMVGERMNKSFGKEVREKEMSWLKE
jgi:cystathionine beta-lyase family protein involved in aluminum resistance